MDSSACLALNTTLSLAISSCLQCLQLLPDAAHWRYVWHTSLIQGNKPWVALCHVTELLWAQLQDIL